MHVRLAIDEQSNLVSLVSHSTHEASPHVSEQYKQASQLLLVDVAVYTSLVVLVGGAGDAAFV